MRGIVVITAVVGSVLCLAILPPLDAAGLTMELTIDASLIGPKVSGEIDLFSSALDGMLLQGQSLSLDILFGDEVLARVFEVPEFPGAVLIVQTNAGTFPGQAGLPSTGFWLAPDGTALDSPHDLGRAMGSNGTFAVGLVDVLPADIPGNPVDVSGLHFDFVFPNTGFMVTDANLRLVTFGQSYVVFGTSQQLPEPATVILTMTGLVGSGVIARVMGRREVASSRRC